MKVLNKEQMSGISGAGFSSADFDFNSYDDFYDYLDFMDSLHLEPLYTPEAKEAFMAWCDKYHFDAQGAADMNGWTL